MVRDARELRGAWATFQRHWYGVPAADLSPFVAGYWAAEWDLCGQQPYEQKIVPYPNVQLTFRDGDAVVRGPERGHVVRVLEGRGRVFGVTFRPGCFRPFLGASVATITGRTLPASAVFGPGLPLGGEKEAVGGSGLPLGGQKEAVGGSGLPLGGQKEAVGGPGLPLRRQKEAVFGLDPPQSQQEVEGLPQDHQEEGEDLPQGQPEEVEGLPQGHQEEVEGLPQGQQQLVEEFLRARLPAPDPLAEQAAAIVALVQAEPQLTRVDALAARAGIGVRRLQRLFAEYVGLGPKWVIRRYRLHEVGERLASGVDIDWVRLAVELGYADQAHFVRDFTAMVGEPPTRYAERYPRR
ncbi:helix-turn-helix domain-containing protein [Actinoplanes sp. NPDC048791]|uniref:helix-turn-helix domain-containing protein n=1 Tax=Actinoplanes sp. NPDC048791 TaxID=3154623 RepID=UPI0033C6FA48